jgi:hypothetical protein
MPRDLSPTSATAQPGTSPAGGVTDTTVASTVSACANGSPAAL